VIGFRNGERELRRSLRECGADFVGLMALMPEIKEVANRK
jgi:hypothetical protein